MESLDWGGGGRMPCVPAQHGRAEGAGAVGEGVGRGPSGDEAVAFRAV